MAYSRPQPPSDAGEWTLLQSRADRNFWQWDRQTPRGVLSRFVILRDRERLDFDTFDEAEALFEAMESDDSDARLDLPSF